MAALNPTAVGAPIAVAVSLPLLALQQREFEVVPSTAELNRRLMRRSPSDSSSAASTPSNCVEREHLEVTAPLLVQFARSVKNVADRRPVE
jgi:hypothetical protein